MYLILGVKFVIINIDLLLTKYYTYTVHYIIFTHTHKVYIIVYYKMNVVNPSGKPQARYPRLLGVVPMPEVVVRCVTTVFSVWLMCWSLQKAYWIRTFALKEYGHVIHEFDPWFNYRASLYLLRNGWGEFFRWFDYESWYPLGRPVGTTIYPGLQITAVAVHWALRALGPQYAGTMNWVCCHLPLLGRGAGVVCDGAARVGNERKIHRGSGHGGGHGRHTRAPDALRGGRVRQRVHCDICNGADILHVGAITSQREVVADWAACRAQLRVHGGSMGRVYICAQYGRTARCTDSTAGLGEGCLQHTDTPQLHAVFYCWHMHSGMRTACGMDAV